MANGGSHAVIKRFINNRNREHTAFTIINIFMFQHHTVSVKAVYDDILVCRFIIVTDNRHGVPILLDTVVQQFHLGRCNSIGVIGIGVYFFNGNGDNTVHRAFVSHHSPTFLYFSRK